VAADRPKGVEDLSAEEETRMFAALLRGGVDLVEGDAASC